MTDILADDLLTLTADIVAAHVSFNKIDTGELTRLIGSVHAALGKLGQEAQPEASPQEPAVPISASVKADHLVCLEDGMKMKMLKRHLATHHGLTPEDYRAKWGLRPDYPMAAPNYAKTRQAIALQTGLGRKAATAQADNEASKDVMPEPRMTAAPFVETAPEPIEASLPATEVEAPPAPVEAEVAAPVEAAKPAEVATPASAENGEKPAPRARRTLRPVFTPRPEPTPAAAATDNMAAVQLLCDAVQNRTCVSAIYNKQHVVLAPHIVFTRHDEPFMRGVALQREGKRPANLKLATFRLTGLVGLTATTKKFAQSDLFDPNDPEYEGTTLATV